MPQALCCSLPLCYYVSCKHLILNCQIFPTVFHLREQLHVLSHFCTNQQKGRAAYLHVFISVFLRETIPPCNTAAWLAQVVGACMQERPVEKPVELLSLHAFCMRQGKGVAHILCFTSTSYHLQFHSL